jgi:CRISPR-associated protein Cmr6
MPARILQPGDLRLPPVIHRDKGESGAYPQLGSSPNAGLLWNRYLPEHSRPQPDAWKGYGVIRWFEKRIVPATYFEAPNIRPLKIEVLRKRRESVLKRRGCAWLEFAATARRRCLVGQGNASSVENSGLAFHGTYGFPIVPGSSLKGLARHYLSDLYANDLVAFLAENAAVPPIGNETADLTTRMLFGDESEPQVEGGIVFHDGWPMDTGESWFDVDVLTVHHKRYYEGQGCADDTDSPNPVHFLTVRSGTEFRMLLSLSQVGRRWPTEKQTAALRCVYLLLKAVLTEWGAGAKTGAGYGRMTCGSEEVHP